MRHIGLVATFWALGCVPQLDDCADDDGCPAARTCQQGYCLPPDAQPIDARVRDRGVDAAQIEDAHVEPPEMRVNGPDPCNGEDDDGDGVVDEDFISNECVAGFGPCRQRGSDACVAGAPVCSAVANEALIQPETCNAIDDDCDGQIDEAGADGLCCPVPEVCNQTDDDCDGRVDELAQLGPALSIGRHGGQGARVLQIAATDAHVVVLTNDADARRAVFRIFERANLRSPIITKGVEIDDALPTQMITRGGRFIIAASGVRSGVILTRMSITDEGELEFETVSAVLIGRPDQLALEAFADGRLSVVAHSPMRMDWLSWFTVPEDFGGIPEAIEVQTSGFAIDAGFAAGLWGEALHVAWRSQQLNMRTILAADMIQDPGQVFGDGATRPTMASLGVPGGDPVLLWQTDPDPAAPRLGMRKLAGGAQSTFGPVRGDRPTTATVDDARLLVGWRTTDDLAGRVGLMRMVERRFELDAELTTGPARRAPVMAVAGNTVSVAWLASDGEVFLQHHTLDCAMP